MYLLPDYASSLHFVGVYGLLLIWHQSYHVVGFSHLPSLEQNSWPHYYPYCYTKFCDVSFSAQLLRPLEV